MPKQMQIAPKDEVVVHASHKLLLEAPKKYQVVLCNDDYTPMGFVVEVIQRFFHLTEAVATKLMMEVHTQGRAVCGVYTCEIAETIVGLVNEYASLNEYPLLCVMEAI